MGRLRWKKQPKMTGLASIGSGPRGSEYHDGENKFASTGCLHGAWGSTREGWFWVAGWESTVPHKNTCTEPCGTEEEAKKQAVEYVKRHLEEQALPEPPE